jgi:hypothetical protein
MEKKEERKESPPEKESLSTQQTRTSKRVVQTTQTYASGTFPR